MTDAARTRVAVLGPFGPAAPSFRVRAMIPREELGHLGVTMAPLSLFVGEEPNVMRRAGFASKLALARSARQRLMRRLKDDAGAYDVAMVQRQADLFPTLGLERMAANGRRLVYDVDDAIWVDVVGSGHHPLAMLKGTRRKARWLARRADHVIAGNRILAEWLSRFSDRVTIVPSLVDHREISVRHHEEGRVVTLGWIGSFSTVSYLEKLREPLERLAAKLPQHDFRMIVMGGEPPRLGGVQAETLAWSPEAERAALARMDIGLMPLPDNRWTRGKCAYKALQYMSAGVPVVADDVGISAEVVADSVGGLIVRDTDGWADAMATLAGDAALRNRMGAAGRERVEDKFSVTRWAPVLAGILRGDP